MGSIALINGRVCTADVPGWAEAVLVSDGNISCVGTSAEVAARAAAAGVATIDVGGRIVTPGLMDSHVHVMLTGVNMTGINLYDCGSIAEVLDLIDAGARAAEPGQWVFGKRLDESRLAEGRPPTAAELDTVAHGHPVYIADRGYHYSLINGVALGLVDLPAGTVGIYLDGGRPTGRLHQRANGIARSAFLKNLTDARREDAVRAVATLAAEKGVTAFHAMEAGQWGAEADIDLIQRVAGSLPVDITHIYWDSFDIAAARAKGLDTIGGDLTIDGSIGSRTAKFADPYADEPGTSGVLYHDPATVTDFIVGCHKAGLSTGFHAIGELGVRQVLDCLEEALRLYPTDDHRLRIEHFGWSLPGDIERCARLGATISTQSAFTYLRGGPGSVYERRLGTDRARRGYPIRAFLDAGIVVGNGSDSDVTPIDPALDIVAAVHPPYPEHAISFEEAVTIQTLGVARIGHEEATRGSITPGKRGDLTVLSTTSPDRLEDLHVVTTILAGRITYQEKDD
ncbi:amidohydrolase [Propionicicella superfundia]|uniref:amidohydrolase n=1 Tax=Propionicicella superfundia TaxID=348582 RepID=UPI000410F6EF|nr:amidohydrolase [Propionicicella superfundia]